MGKRLFLALSPDEESRRRIERYAESLHGALKAYQPRWIKPELYHLTLHFFGDVEESALSLLEESFSALSGSLSPPLLTLEELLFLPSLRKPRVLTLRFSSEPAEAFGPILEKVQTDAQGDPKPWLPHLSLARFKDHRANRWPTAVLKPKQDFPKPPKLWFEPTSIELMESFLSPAGPRYERRKSFRFAPKNFA